MSRSYIDQLVAAPMLCRRMPKASGGGTPPANRVLIVRIGNYVLEHGVSG